MNQATEEVALKAYFIPNLPSPHLSLSFPLSTSALPSGLLQSESFYSTTHPGHVFCSTTGPKAAEPGDHGLKLLNGIKIHSSF